METSGLPRRTAPPKHPSRRYQSRSATIYSLVLVKEDIIKLKSFAGHPEPGRTTNRPVVLQSFRNQGKRRGQLWVPFCPRGWVPAPPSFMAILGVSKAIRAEAAAIVYGRNAFSFNTTAIATRFLTLISDNKIYVREIIIQCSQGIRRDFSLLLGELLDLKSFRMLELPLWREWQLECYGFHRYPWAYSLDATLQEAAILLKPLLTVLHGAYRAQGLSASVLDVVQPHSDRLEELLRYQLRFVLDEEDGNRDPPTADVLELRSNPPKGRKRKGGAYHDDDDDF